MAISKSISSKTTIKQFSTADMPVNPLQYVSQRYEADSTAGQTVINLNYAADMTAKTAFILIIDGKILREGAAADYQWTSVQANNTSSQITLTSALPAGVNIIAIQLGTMVQAQPSLASLQAQVNQIGTKNGINYIAYPDAEAGATNWNTFADGASLVDGIGGSPTATFATTTTSPLRGSASFLYTPGALGNGFSYDMTIDPADKAKMLSISFDYGITGTFADGDVQIMIYDITNAQLIQPAGYKVLNTLVNQTLKATFQTASNSTSYRLIGYQSTSNTSYTLKLDNIVVGPQMSSSGPAMSDWSTSNPGFTFSAGFGTVVQNLQWKREGDTLKVKGYIQAGTTAATVGYIQLPWSIDTVNKMGTQGVSVLGTAFEVIAGASSSMTLGERPVIFYDGSTANQVFFASANGANVFTKLNGNSVVNSNEYCPINFECPITGWSSNTVQSADTDTRVCSFTAHGATATVTSSASIVTWLTVDKDTHAGFNGTTTWTCQVTGEHRVSASLRQAATYAAGNGAATRIYKNGAEVANNIQFAGGACGNLIPAVTHKLSLVAGDTISIYADNGGTTPTVTASNVSNLFSIERLSGPAVVQASESVNAKYYNTAGTALPNSLTNLPFATKDYDSHNSYSSGIYTVPVSGKYRVSCTITSTFTGVVGQGVATMLFKNTVSLNRIASFLCETAVNGLRVIGGARDVNCLAGDTLEIRAIRDAGITPSLDTSTAPYGNILEIERVGN